MLQLPGKPQFPTQVVLSLLPGPAALLPMSVLLSVTCTYAGLGVTSKKLFVGIIDGAWNVGWGFLMDTHEALLSVGWARGKNRRGSGYGLDPPLLLLPQDFVESKIPNSNLVFHSL